ncbi:hypothetical protein DMB65_12905 [Flavobacterium cheongpyeongense]|uniref:ABC transporter n=1 Tax=Flavobacterium cheongpyeongense TaxID=2212651 RepID=A0A2V4C2Q5_9FLAO|nr:DUF6526 family protein [Flavobacterium cheongpyeongense]PXY40494.1 hypothetical protein DMB65_12905 [Flavobacterium cheongpyeongense]
MKTQSYKNHVRFYPPHHFIYYPILTVLMFIAIYFAFTTPEKLLWGFITVIFIFLFCLAFMLRQHYALILQNRIVKLEIRYRYFVLTGTRFETIEYQFTDDQLFAFRFAPDKEFLPLIERALAENLSADAIKKAIVSWKGDYNRV